MSADAGLAARIIESSAGGFSGLATSLLYEREPALTSRYGEDGFSRWREQIDIWLRQLAAALDADEPGLFEASAGWARASFDARRVDLVDLRRAMAALRDTLDERLPAAPGRSAVGVVDRAITALERPESFPGVGLEIDREDDRRALEYLHAVLEGRPREAVDRVLAAIDGGAPVRRAYLDWLIPAQREAGRLWHLGELGIAEERLVTSTTQRLMALLCERERPSVALDRTVVLACVSCNTHDLGLRAIADFHEMAGWRVLNLGTDVPPDEIANSAGFFDADLVVLAATLDVQLRAVRETIEAIRAVEGNDARIVVGGAAFAAAPDLWRRLGADGLAESIEDAEPLGRRLTD